MLKTLEYIILFIVLVLLQALLFNNIEISGFLNIYIYMLFILILPGDIAGWALLLLCGLMGVTIDLICGTSGMHTIATLLMGFLRPSVLRLFVGSDINLIEGAPASPRIGTRKFLQYAGLLVFVHNAMFFFLETLTFVGFGYTLIRILLSTAASVAMIYFCQLPLFRYKGNDF